MIIAILLIALAQSAAESTALALADFRIRDPFILPVPEEGKYYVYGTSVHLPPASGFDTYVSSDLKTWSGPVPVFRPEPGFWATSSYWAPEVFVYKGRYYMFATFSSKKRNRGTQVLVADKPTGPFRVHSDGPVTPMEWLCLDGTLFIDDTQQPWMVFCHEWLQVRDGEICAMKLSPELDRAIDKPVLLFKATDAKWVVESGSGEHKGFVTDGPFLHRAKSGGLMMLWSSFGKGGYKTAVATSDSGNLLGPWKQGKRPIFEEDGGHAMLFTSFDGALLMSLHAPNRKSGERARLFRADEAKGTLRLSSWPAQQQAGK
ncbi:MAG: glycoside hydrolase family 43 protein [Candidatus Hydrogenedentales bacterium]|jgi:beta-xylosidase